ncbi:MAG: hypothetical protein KHX45_20735 [Clostridiales bacterium]|nr:hypothetical protein [Clostridiales bacterium]DAJ91019.1 MAG TPA: hypothetical protein [Caudoviricetes sp.]
MIKIGDSVICVESGVYGIVIEQYYPTAYEQQTMIRCDDGRKYHAPTRTFVKKDYQTDEEINSNNAYLSEVGKYASKFARNHGMSVCEAMSTPTVIAYSNYCNAIFRKDS